MNSVERIFHFIDVKPEAPRIISAARPPRGWPNAGSVEFRNVWLRYLSSVLMDNSIFSLSHLCFSLRYRDGLDPVLKGISFSIKPQEKIGVVGRTGAGKSSLTNVLFRLIEPFRGTVIIDGEDISKFGLHDVRGNLSIIPQDPVLFSGTIRSNLDPFNKFSDKVHVS